MILNEKYSSIISIFKSNLPNPTTELQYNSPFELLVAVILSAQCTDKRVNQITPILFKELPTPFDFANSSVEHIYSLIKSCSYPNNKAQHLHSMATILIRQFNGIVPNTIEELQMLPGVGRKTANVIVSVLYNHPAMAVDTHVYRVSKRIGLTPQAKTVRHVEDILTQYTPQHEIHNMHHWLILHGRYTCTARNPKCNECKISNYCDYFRDITNKDLSSLNF
ncbi:MAG TPA: endonuclease III [Bacteroidales bacterium]|nr:endonuclease III [Bacteroidales bacterium]HRS19441.1 endonuclease III [Bacteroidales bacterium]